jgi:hypothetical protein
MEYESTAISAPKQKALRKLEKSYKDINKLPSYKIVGHLMYRHRVGLLITVCLLQFGAYSGGLQVLFDSLRGL